MQKVLPMTRYRSADNTRRRTFVAVKRLFDIFVSFCMLVVLFPIGLVVAVIAAIDTKGSPLFIQNRMGRGNRPFKMLKFRTMSVNAPSDVATHKLEGADSYISKIGGLLRKLSLDELPQLLNILKGDMSFVGPRPVVLTEKDLLELRTRNGASDVRPGLTGWAQVNGRDNVTVTEKARLDGCYARCMSASMDMKILGKTVGYVLRSQGIREGANPAISSRHSGEQSA